MSNHNVVKRISKVLRLCNECIGKQTLLRHLLERSSSWICRRPNVIFLDSSLVDSEIDVTAVRVLAVECIMAYLDFSKVVDFEILTLVARRHLLSPSKNLLVGRECVLASISILAIKWQHFRDLCFQL